jgi:hypothetical protein
MQKYSNYYSFKINNYSEYQEKVNKHQQELYASILTPIFFYCIIVFNQFRKIQNIYYKINF